MFPRSTIGVSPTAGDLARSALFGSIPVAAGFSVLSMAQLYVVAFVGGCCTVAFGIANVAVLPQVVAEHELIEANAKLEMVHSVADVPGPGIGGALVTAIGGPAAIAIESVRGSLTASGLAPRCPDLVPDAQDRLEALGRAFCGVDGMLTPAPLPVSGAKPCAGGSALDPPRW